MELTATPRSQGEVFELTPEEKADPPNCSRDPANRSITSAPYPRKQGSRVPPGDGPKEGSSFRRLPNSYSSPTTTKPGPPY